MKVRPRSTRAGFIVLLLSLVLAAGIPASAGAAPAGGLKSIDPTLVKKLKDSARGSVTISVDDATSFASFIRAGRNGDLLPSVKGQPQGKAKGFLKQFGGLLGVTDVDSDLVQTAAGKDKYGATHITYEQRYRGVPVFGGVVKVHVDAAGDLTAVNGTIVPAVDLATDPRLSASDARARAIGAVKDDPPVASTGGAANVGRLRAESTRLVVYRTGLVKGEAGGSNELVYHVVVTNGKNIRDAVFVGANTGKVINRYTLVDNALYRVLYESNPNTKPIWEEGDKFPHRLNQDQQNIVNFSGDSYRFFFNAFGRDSYDAAGAQMRSVNNDPTIACPNANWNGATTNYCNGVTSDDVVAHEWGHAYTEYTHGLIYQWQPGALNESYSDIWGETIDMINNAGTDSPAPRRTVGSCSTFTPEIPIVQINSPASIARICAAGSAAFGPPVSSTNTTTGDVVVALDAVETGGTNTNACSPLTNAAAVAGKLAYADRGACTFKTKTKNAQDAGAIGVIIGNNAAGGGPFGMADDATITTPITISTLSVSTENGAVIRNTASGTTVNATLKVRSGTSPAEGSYRWLMGEDSTAFAAPGFSGAIRDMWTPTCFGDPGKVTDAEYHCDTTDAGGVHSNSGVPNHGYALLVDGGTYNGQTITAIGLVKAAHLYWQAQSVYQEPASKFPDHADALEASCDDLIGVPLEGLSTSTTPFGPSGESISAADCAEVTEMIAAVELRTDPTAQCSFGPALDPNTPNPCGRERDPAVAYQEDFEDGLAGWTVTNTGVFSGWPGTNWVADSTLPGGRTGTAAFAAGPDAGSCDGGAGDISGVMRLESPAIVIPASNISPRLSFDHYFATEPAFDGGNVKISINGGAFAIVPASAFTFNSYNGTLATTAQGNTNPLQGEPAFTGTDGGEVTGSWGTSQVDLAGAGVNPGDTIKLRFDFGRDGCGGRDGWYVDDVEIVACRSRGKP